MLKIASWNVNSLNVRLPHVLAWCDVAQPDVGRVGGLTEARRVCDMAAVRGRRIVPHCWKTGIGIAASAHLAAVTPHCPYIEFLPAE